MDKFDIALGILMVLVIIPIVFVTGCLAIIAAQYTTVIVVSILFNPEWTLLAVLNMSFSEVWTVTKEYWYVYTLFLFFYWFAVVSVFKSKD